MGSFRSRPVGWRGESYRHYLAAKGFKTRRYDALQESKAETFLKSLGQGVAAIPQRAWVRRDIQMRRAVAEGAEPYRERLKVSRAAIATPLTGAELELQERLRSAITRKQQLYGAAEANDAYTRWTKEMSERAIEDIQNEIGKKETEIRDVDKNINDAEINQLNVDIGDYDEQAKFKMVLGTLRDNRMTLEKEKRRLELQEKFSANALNAQNRGDPLTVQQRLVLGSHVLDAETENREIEEGRIFSDVIKKKGS